MTADHGNHRKLVLMWVVPGTHWLERFPQSCAHAGALHAVMIDLLYLEGLWDRKHTLATVTAGDSSMSHDIMCCPPPGNAEEMVKRNKDGSPKYTDGEPEVLTSHTLNPVPIAIGGPGLPKNIRFR